MKREIKFRVWNGTDMIYDVTVGKFGTFYVNPGDKGDGLDPNDSASLTPFTTRYHEDTPVMQFTGLLDKEGKDIWEGDLLLVAGMMDVKHGVIFNPEKAQFMMYEWGTNNYSPIADGQYSIVVGNIYQNINLVSETKQ